MDYTIRIIRNDCEETIIAADSGVVVLRPGNDDFETLKAEGVGEWQARYGDKSNGDPYEDLKAIISFNSRECGSRQYIYSEDRAYVMNATGKTVANI